MHYHVCESKSVKGLQDEVTHLLAKGWRPTGGISAANSNATGGWWYYQAMVLQRDEAYAVEAHHETFAPADPELA